ncbi:hypothetical protein BGW36DRAFT_361636 [Talaromyces proteolyticus]|uniref:Carrier domain-containing protein n=1 Tax=Talaromyces proteolyticus TaxID=1131652 RepID=A0AAD4KR74_9EURO|nr:uncharacterized protein BGW36DRAFT_361636 [Talaromyces proteolyticus]KAH8693797.1 hypothetical protein BGW36DRAFT_361636 [Talaromyces proteolyticus]
MPSQSCINIHANAFEAELGLAQLLKQNLQLFGNAVAIESNEFHITFNELHRKALNLMQRIHDHQIQTEEPIGILAPRGINHILSQAAVVYAGGSCVTLDVDHTDQHITSLLRNLNASIILTDLDNSHRLHDFQHIVVDHSANEKNVESENAQVSENGIMSRSHIFHTSGSTGKPKAVQVLAMGVINLVFNQFAPVRKGHRLGHVCNISFDVSLWEIWSALLHGATIVVFDKTVVLDPVLFSWRLQKDQIDVMWQTTSLLATVAHAFPQAYSSLDTLLTGGEAINIQTIRIIFENGPPKRLFNVYGPTELSVFTTYHLVSPAELEKGNIPIGRPLSNLQSFVVDENLQTVPQGEVGELLVGGAGVAAGYFANPEKTSLVFVNAPHLAITCQASTGLFYRTGDLVRINETGLIEYVGRSDNEVKIRGQRVELESIESSLLQTKLVSATAALKVEPEELQSGSILLAYVIPVSPDVDIQSILQVYRELAPNLMVPRLELVESFALTGSGKIDRKRLAREYIDRLESLRLSRKNKNGTERKTEAHLKEIWLDILGLDENALKNTDDFFAIGGTSLQAITLASWIQKTLNVQIRVATLFEYPTLKGMSDLVDKIRNGVPSDTTAERASWLRDSQLGKDLEPIGDCIPDWQCECEGRVFMTGSTGFIGAFLLVELLSMPQINTVTCLVRAKDQETALHRIRSTLKKYKLDINDEAEAKILALPGDVSQPDLGLGWQRYDDFAIWASVVFHLAAQVSYVQPYSTHRASNVLGTLNVIRFANSGRIKGLHYASSISAYGPTGIVTGANYIPENEKPVAHSAALSYDTGYAQSQFAAEGIAWNAIEKGIPLTIYRPGFVLGHSKTGMLNPDDFFGRIVRSCMDMGIYPVLPRQREDFVPVDFVVRALLHVASDRGSHGHAYNLVNPSPAPPIDLNSTFEMINSLLQKSVMRGVPYSDWLSQANHDRLQPLIPMLEEKVLDNRSRWEMQQDMPEFGTRNLSRALCTVPDLLECPPVPSLFAAYLPHWIQEAQL